MAEKCFNRVRTAESRGLSGASPSAWIQEWPERGQIFNQTKSF